MNITFLVGNGFDLNLGLDTQYSDFLETYTNTKANDTENIKWFKTEVLKDRGLWSAAERAFGACTSQFADCGLKADAYDECYEDFCINLAKYLQEQEKRVEKDGINDKIEGSFPKALTSYLDGFREIPRTQIVNSTKTVGQGKVYNFISFNYTEILDKFVNIITKKNGCLGTRVYNNTKYNNSINKVLHVHGYTTKNMVFGVNDDSQIADKTIFDGYGEEYIEQLIKIKSNKMYEENTDEKAHQLLRNSDVIYVYGMSIGETDKLWWERICQVMKEKRYLQLILHKHDAIERSLTGRKYATYIKEERQKFVSFSDYSDEVKDEIMSRIHIDTSNIFIELKDLVKKDGSDTDN